jgi:TrpR-related protein YerC/YecD
VTRQRRTSLPPREAAPAGPPAAPRPEWRTDGVDELCDAILTLRDRDEAAAFLRDACSLHELEAIAHRWQAARLLDRGVPYARVAAEVGASTATVTRVAHWLRHGEGGYRLVLDRIAPR